MAEVLTRKQMRDRIRRRLGRSTALEAGDAVGNPMAFGGEGQPHPNQPEPTNLRLDDAIADTISEINIQARLGGAEAPVSVSIPAQTANGPYRVDLQTAFFPREAQVNEVKRVWWDAGGGALTILRWTNIRDMDAMRIDFTSIPPSVPQQCWVNNYGLWVSPAPASPGTLLAYIGHALLGPATDDDIIPQLPADLYRVVLDGAAFLICADQPDDQVMASRAAILGPRYEKGINDIKTTFGTMGQSNPRLIALPYRIRRGSR